MPYFPQTLPMPAGQKSQRETGSKASGKQRNGQGRGGAAKQPAATQPRNYMKNNEITHQQPPWTDVYTVMMRNLPNKYTQHMLLDELGINKFRLQSEFDFFYLPMDHYSAVNLGYCFINFVDPCVANAFAAAFQGRRMRHFNSQKTIVVMPASMQGYEKNYAYYSSTRVAQADDPQYRPIFTKLPPSQEVAQFQPVPAVMWAQNPYAAPENPYAPEAKAWSMAWAQQPYVNALPQEFCSTDDEQETFGAIAGSAYSSQSLGMPDNSEESESKSGEDPFAETFSPGHRQRLLIRNTFLAVPERSPSVERCLARQCKSAPVSAPQSATGSARIEFDAKRPSGLDYAVVAAASCLAMDLGCVAVADPSTDSSGSGSLRLTSGAGSVTTAESEPVRQPSSCGSADLPSHLSPSDLEAVLGSPGCPSKGSALHKLGSCKPCAFHAQGGPDACKNDTECTFCHLCEPGEKKRRKKEKQAQKKDLREKIRVHKAGREMAN